MLHGPASHPGRGTTAPARRGHRPCRGSPPLLRLRRRGPQEL